MDTNNNTTTGTKTNLSMRSSTGAEKCAQVKNRACAKKYAQWNNHACVKTSEQSHDSKLRGQPSNGTNTTMEPSCTISPLPSDCIDQL